MAQPITNLSTGALVNLIETRSGVKYQTPFLIIATGSGNPYGSDNVLCIRNNITTASVWGSSSSPLYDGSTVDNWLTNTYLLRFDDATKNCIATSTIKNYSVSGNENYTIARKIFLPSPNELGVNISKDPSDRILYFSSASQLIGYSDSGLVGVYDTRHLSSGTTKVYVNSYGALYTDAAGYDAQIGLGHSTRPMLNLKAASLVSSEPNADGSYNLLHGLYAAVGADNTGVTAAEVDSSVFLTQITAVGSYTFTFDGTDWVYDNSTVDLADYGITVTGTPAANDTVIVTIPQSNQVLDFTCALGETAYMPTQCLVDWAEVNNGTTALQLCNNYNDASPTWENAAKNTIHDFTNAAKTATDWCVGAKFYAESENTIKIYAPHALVRKW